MNIQLSQKNSRKYNQGWLATLLMSSIVLTFCMQKCYFFIWKLPISCSMLFFACYYLGIRYLASINMHHARSVGVISMIVGVILWGGMKGIMKISIPSSSLTTQLLWDYPVPAWLLILQFFFWLRALPLFKTQRIKNWKQKILDKIFPVSLQKKLLFDRSHWSIIAYSLMLILIYLTHFLPANPGLLLVGSIISFEILVCLGEIGIKFFIIKKRSTPINFSLSQNQLTYHFFLYLFVGICLITNLLVVVLLGKGNYTCTAGVLTYPITFLLVDIMTELYGPKKAKKAIWAGFVSNLLLLIGVWFTAMLPIDISKKIFWDTFGFVSASLVASMIAYIMAQFMGIYIFCQLKKATQGSYLWLRNNVTTIISQGVDTAIFALMAWGIWYLFKGEMVTYFSFGQWIRIAFNEYIIKIILALLDTPILYLVLGLLKRIGIQGVKEEVS